MTSIHNAVHQAVFNLGGVTSAAWKLEVHPQTINSWVRRKFVPKYGYARRLAKLSGISINALRQVEVTE